MRALPQIEALYGGAGNGQTVVPVSSLRILMVTPHFLPRIGGTEMHTLETGKRIVDAGHSVTVLTTNMQPPLPEVDLVDGIDIIRVPSWGNRLDLCIAPKINEVIRSGEWDLVHCQGIHTFVAPIAMLAALRTEIPYVVTFHSGGHSSWLRNSIRSGQWSMLRPLAARANKLIGVSEFETSYFRDKLGLSPDRMTTIPNGASLPRSNVRPSSGEGDLIVSTGRLERYKGHHRVLQALPEVLKRRPNARLRIVGSGPYESDLREMARDLGISEFVTIEPIAAGDRHGMADLLSRAALVTLLSEYESHGIAALEAISLKRSVLVTNATALREFVQQGLAVGVEPGSSPQQLADAIVDQLEQPHIPPEITPPTWDDCATELLRLYASIAKGEVCAS